MAGSGIRVNAGKNNNVLGNICLSNKNHGVKIEYVAGGVRVKSNRVTSNAKSGILLWKSKATEVSGNTVAEKNKGNGVYAYGICDTGHEDECISAETERCRRYM